MNKKASFFIDDVLWVFRDLTREQPASLFDNPYMKTLKDAHDKYGVKTQLNVFYKTSFWYGADEFSLSDDTVISQSLLDKYENILTANQINKILEVNISTLNANYKYHYIDSEKLADKVFSGGKVNVKDAKNNYIINFYTGTIIALYDSKSEISGTVKGLTDILLDVNDEI